MSGQDRKGTGTDNTINIGRAFVRGIIFHTRDKEADHEKVSGFDSVGLGNAVEHEQ